MMQFIDRIYSRPRTASRAASIGFARAKGNASAAQLGLLAVLVVVPLAIVGLRLLTVPGVFGGGAGGGWPSLFQNLGLFFERSLSLANVRPDVRARVEYVVFIPACALLITFVRLTLGVRMLGPCRALLIAVAFQLVGFAASLFLMALVIVTVVLIRPVLKMIRLPRYARVSIVLSIAAATIVIMMLAGPRLGTAALWRVVFSPVVVLGLSAEGFARTLERESLRAALWRATTTLVVAIIIALVLSLPGLQMVLLRFPELIVAQIAGIVLISEFLDLRLLQEYDAAARGIPIPRLLHFNTPMKVAVVRNRHNEGIVAHLGRPTPEVYGRGSVQRIMDGLRAGGHEVRVFEGDMTLLAELNKFIPPDPKTGQPTGIVFNLAYGIQGDCRYTHVPAMLEMAGIAYTGANPLGHSLALDKVVTKVLMQHAGVPTPRFCVMQRPGDDVGNLRFPVIVKPRHESSSYGLAVVHDRDELARAVRDVVAQYRQGALVEEYIEGREINVGLLGNHPVECLPLVELDFGNRADTTLTWEDKCHTSVDEPTKLCPAPLDDVVAERIRECSLHTYYACHCRDYARVDIRLDPDGTPYVLEINSIATLGAGGSFVMAAAEAGLTFSDVVCRIVEVARQRYVDSSRPVELPALEVPSTPEPVRALAAAGVPG